MSAETRVDDPASKNIQWQDGLVGRRERERILGQRGCVLWMTGLSGSGKSTIARGLERRLVECGRLAYVLDGDNIRHGLNADLGFSQEERTENIRRVGEVAALLADAGLITITAFIAPYRSDRARARDAVERMAPGRFLEVHVDADLEECERRDPKGLYRKARRGEIAEFTGIDAPYEAPEVPDCLLPTGRQGVEQSIEALIEVLRERGFLEAP